MAWEIPFMFIWLALVGAWTYWMGGLVKAARYEREFKYIFVRINETQQRVAFRFGYLFFIVGFAIGALLLIVGGVATLQATADALSGQS
jgi:hypothetical protein